MSITITVSEMTEKKIRQHAEETGQDIDKFVGGLVDGVWDEYFPDENEQKAEQKTHSLFDMAGMFASGRSDISEMINDHMYDEGLDPHQGFGTDK